MLGLPAEAADRRGAVVAGGLLESTADAVAVGVVGVGQGTQVGHVDGLEQAAAEHRWGGTQRGGQSGDIGAVDGDHGAPQRERRAVGVFAGLLLPVDGEGPLGRRPAVLELLAEVGVR